MAVERRDIAIPLRLPEDEALALAQLCKRVDYDTCVRFTSRFDKYHDRDEGDVAWCAVNLLRDALAEAGFAPR